MYSFDFIQQLFARCSIQVILLLTLKGIPKVMFFFFFLTNIGLKGSMKIRKGLRDLPLNGSLPKYLQCLGMGQTEARIKELQLILSCGHRGQSTQILCCFPRCINMDLGWKCSSWDWARIYLTYQCNKLHLVSHNASLIPT